MPKECHPWSSIARFISIYFEIISRGRGAGGRHERQKIVKINRKKSEGKRFQNARYPYPTLK